MSNTHTLVNLTRRSQVIQLDHAAFRNRESGFQKIAMTVIDESPTGARSRRTFKQAVPGSITVPAGGEVSGLHPAIKNCAQVRTGLAATPPRFAVKKDDPKKKTKAAKSKPKGKKAEGVW